MRKHTIKYGTWDFEDLQMGQVMEFRTEKESFPYRLNFEQVEWGDTFYLLSLSNTKVYNKE